MVTTIQLEEETAEQLRQMKEVLKVKTFDEVVKKLMKKNTASMFGILGHLDRKELMKDLRDKHDRF